MMANSSGSEPKVFLYKIYENFICSGNLREILKHFQILFLNIQLECNICSMPISRPDHLKTHMKNAHCVDEKLHFVCPTCGMVTLYRSNWTAHMKNKHKLTDDEVEKIKDNGIPTKKMAQKKKCKYIVFQ